MKLLFITRKYPPMVGGMENVSYSLAQEFKARVPTTLITWGKSQKYLPIFIPLAFFKALYLIPTKKITHIHIGDALLSPLGLLLKIIFRIKSSITVHGLDIIFNFLGYQLIVPKCVAQFDKVICVSNATLNECIKRGIPKDKCTVVPWGVYPNAWKIKATRRDLEKIVGVNLKNKKVLITVGRLVKRKGVYWFIENVLSKLDNNYIYLVIGEGEERIRIENLITKLGLKDRVYLVGKITDQKLKIIYNTADLFVMPNIRVDDSFEGFGIVAIEASSVGLPVIASDLEGISDAVINGKTGLLVNNGDYVSFNKKIKSSISLDNQQVYKKTIKNYSWNQIINIYLKTIY